MRSSSLLARLLLLLGAAITTSPVIADDVVIINFTAGLTPGTFSGPDEFSPYVPGNVLSTFAAFQPDVLRADGQFYIQDFNGAGTYSASTPGNRFLFHSPLIERIEADTWRVEGPSSHGTQTAQRVVTFGAVPITQRSKFLLPADTILGDATITFDTAGNITDFSYSLDFSDPGVPSFEVAGNPNFQLAEFQSITAALGDATFSSRNVGDVGGADALLESYGLNTVLSLGSYSPGVLGSTVLDTTRGMLDSEILSNTDELGGATPNISSSGRLDGGIFPNSIEPNGDVYLADPFFGESGDLIIYSNAGSNDLVLGVAVIAAVPEPGSVVMLVGCSTLVVFRRRKR
ncbi:MAG: PEP-CTERM sorting domain-containing protein [Planctomycetota bacterium]